MDLQLMMDITSKVQHSVIGGGGMYQVTPAREEGRLPIVCSMIVSSGTTSLSVSSKCYQRRLISAYTYSQFTPASDECMRVVVMVVKVKVVVMA